MLLDTPRQCGTQVGNTHTARTPISGIRPSNWFTQDHPSSNTNSLLFPRMRPALFEKVFVNSYIWLENIRTSRDGWNDGMGLDDDGVDRKSTRLNSSHSGESRMPSSA